MGLAPFKASILGGSAVLSTRKDGKPGRRLYINIFFQGLSASAPFFTAAVFLATILNLRSAILDGSAVPWRFIGRSSAVPGWSALSEEKKKREQPGLTNYRKI